ncbi:MAG: tyrosine/phenylalanine carboxypeptidase domain-containing protein [Polyangiales bacterium]
MDAALRTQLELDSCLKRVSRAARVLPGLTAKHGPKERGRLVGALESGNVDALGPRFSSESQTIKRAVWHDLEEARRLSHDALAGQLYRDRLDELELELMLIEALGHPKRVRPLAARRFGDGGALIEAAQRILDIPDEDTSSADPDEVPAEGTRSLASILRSVAKAAGIDIKVQVEPKLVSSAAAGERTVFISPRPIDAREAHRLAVHEVLGHLIAAANGRAQKLALFRVGTATAFADQEGLALHLEAESGLMDARRVRTIAARVWVTKKMHEGASFRDVVLTLYGELGFSAVDCVTLGERAFRGGGIARDASYLRGWRRVRRSIQSGEGSLNELRCGRVSARDMPTLRALREGGLACEPTYQPSLSRSLAATGWGTSSWTSPPSLAASLMILDET